MSLLKPASSNRAGRQFRTGAVPLFLYHMPVEECSTQSHERKQANVRQQSSFDSQFLIDSLEACDSGSIGSGAFLYLCRPSSPCPLLRHMDSQAPRVSLWWVLGHLIHIIPRFLQIQIHGSNVTAAMN